MVANQWDVLLISQSFVAQFDFFKAVVNISETRSCTTIAAPVGAHMKSH